MRNAFKASFHLFLTEVSYLASTESLALGVIIPIVQTQVKPVLQGHAAKK